MISPVRQRFTFDEYVQLEATSVIKHEFLGGHVWAMAGGSPEHAGIAGNVTTTLSVQLRGRPCRVFSSDLRVRVAETGLGTYPDVTVICGRIELDPSDTTGHTAINPKLVVEVLSPSTEDYDRGEKLAHYKRIPSLDEIVLVAHDERRLEVWRREGDLWTLVVIRGDAIAPLTQLGCELALAEVYRDPLVG
ncbi:Uma2 family endonuclease [Myxococcota bacterium]|nr:Uma2 family endonuclease [Myxococcota bacterium]